MKFTVVKKIYPSATKTSVGNTIKMTDGKTPTFVLYVSEQVMRRAKCVTGDRVTIAYVKDDRGSKWVLLEADPSGYKVISTKSKGKGKTYDGEYSRTAVKTTSIEDFMIDNFSDPVHYKDDEVEADTGYIAFPFPKKRGLFS